MANHRQGNSWRLMLVSLSSVWIYWSTITSGWTQNTRVCGPTTQHCISGQQTTIASLGLTVMQSVSPFSGCSRTFHSWCTQTTLCNHFNTTHCPSHRLYIAMEHFDSMLILGLAHPSKSAWPLVLHMIPKKKSGSWHPCSSYWALSAATVLVSYPLPCIHDHTASLTGAIFLKIFLWAYRF